MCEKITLHRDGDISVDGAETRLKWLKVGGWHSEFVMKDGGAVLVNHYSRRVFVERVRTHIRSMGSWK